ncbi:MAG: D-aminoacylase [Nitrospirae bacterium]|nr:D-aminoacylase [Nitrospirota bacterium]
MIDILIKNALIYDGTGNAPYEGCVAVEGDTISYAGPSIAGLVAVRTIDAGGMAVTPGFIDVHSHSEFSLFRYPDARSKLLQGVTTEVNGNCGFSAAPINNDARQHMEKEFETYGITDRWEDFGLFNDYLRARRPGINFSTLVGHGNVRASVMGYDNVPASGGDILKMAAHLGSAMANGALGMSTGLIYLPGVFSDTDEIVGIIKASSEPSGGSLNSSCGTLNSSSRLSTGDIVYASHMRSEGDFLLESIGDTLDVGRRTGCRVHLSHLKTAGKHNWHKVAGVLSLIEEAIDEGIRVTCDRYPYIASQTSLDALLPAWVYEGGDEPELLRLKNPDVLARIKSEISDKINSDNYWFGVMVSSVKSEKNKPMEGRSIGELAGKRGVDPFELVIGLLIEESLRVDAIYFSMNEDNLRRILRLDVCMVGSDSAVKGFDGSAGKPHPRGFGTFPRYIGKYVVGEGLMPLRQAIHRITKLSADTFRLAGRGVLAAGARADVVVFDVNRIRDMADFENPYMRPEGIEYVLVNGTVAVDAGSLSTERAGEVL